MPIDRRFAAVSLALAAVLLVGCNGANRISPQAREDLDALRRMTDEVGDSALRERMLLRLANLEAELAADRSPLAALWPAEAGVVKLVYHPFTCIGYRDAAGQYAGIEVRVQPLDAREQVDRVRGRFRFELYEFVPANERRKGRRLGQWDVDLSSAAEERRHWEPHSQSYAFQLQYPAQIEPETRFVLTTMFTDRSGRRVFLEDVRTYLQ